MSNYHFLKGEEILYIKQISPGAGFTEVGIPLYNAVPLGTRSNMLHDKGVPKDHGQESRRKSAKKIFYISNHQMILSIHVFAFYIPYVSGDKTAKPTNLATFI